MSHRDVKPQNILVDGNGGYKLCDFGNAKTLKPSEDENHTFLGTPLYLSPQLRQEMINKMQTLLDRRVRYSPYKSDVYSLGLTVLYMCKLAPPLDLAVLQNLQENTHHILGAIRYSDELKTVIYWMLQVSEHNRPDFQELQTYLNPPPTPLTSLPATSAVMSEADVPSPLASENMEGVKEVKVEEPKRRIEVTNESNMRAGMRPASRVLQAPQRPAPVTLTIPSNCYYCQHDIVTAYFRTPCGEFTCSENCKRTHVTMCTRCKQQVRR